MENNVIHNNEGYGVIVVKPNNQEEGRSREASEGMWSSQGVMWSHEIVHLSLAVFPLLSQAAGLCWMAACALHRQNYSRYVLEQHRTSPNQPRRKTARTAVLPPPQERSGRLIASRAGTKRSPVQQRPRICWRITSLSPSRETSSDAMAWVILAPFSIDGIGHSEGPWLFSQVWYCLFCLT